MSISRKNWLLVALGRHIFGRVLIIALALSSICSILPLNSTLYASTASTNSLVVIAVDVTNQTGYCLEVFKANIGTAQATTTHVRCPAGTLITAKILSLSQAIALHEPYVVLPSSTVSGAVQKHIMQQIQHLLQVKGDILLSKNPAGHPLTRCGSTGDIGLYWADTPGDDFYSSVTFYKSSDCTTVSFNTAAIQTYTSIGRGDYWSYDLYGGQEYVEPNCPKIDSGYHWHGVGRSFGSGYYYENWISWGQVCNGFNWFHNNIGPIN